jgi:hypothetical protein
MKLNYFKYLPVFIGCSLLNLNLTGQKVILSVNEGEEILFPESSISLSDTRGGIQVCTVDYSGNFYVYTGGNKQGPFSKAEDAFLKIIFPEITQTTEEQTNFENKAWDEKYVSVNEKGESFIHAGDKIFGPFSIVKELYFSSDGKQFAATAGLITDKEKYIIEYYLLSSGNPVMKIKGDPGTIRASQSLKTVVVCTEEIIRQEIDQKEIQDYTEKVQLIMKEFENSEMNTDAINKMAAKIDQIKKPESTQPQNNYFIYSNSGISLGPFQSCPPEKNLGFGKNSGEKWHFFDSGKLFVSGKFIQDFGLDFSINNFWWSKTSDGYAFSTYDGLVFSDGKTYPFPLEIMFFEENGKSFLKWITLEERRNFVLYQKEL